jgi:hypothetical protein
MTSFNPKRAGVIAALALASAVIAGPALALVVTAGGQEIRIDARSEINITSSNSLAFNDVPGAGIIVIVPSGTTRHFDARFAAESRCFGASTAPFGYCSLRIIATRSTGAVTFLNPNAGINFAFDTNPSGAADAVWEGNAMERSIRLPAGTYRISVQRAVTNSGTFFHLDDWHFTVETNL